MFQRDSYVPHRRLFYFLIWCIAVAVLALTAFRIHFTRKNFGTHDPIIAFLLVTAILTMIWVPLTLLFHRRAPGVGTTNAATTDTHRTDTTSHFGGLHRESSGNLLLWIMWLVGAAIATHHWPNSSVVGHGRQATILLAIVALSLTELALMTLVKVLALMEYSAVGASRGGGVGYGGAGAGGVGRHEKVTTNANTAAV